MNIFQHRYRDWLVPYVEGTLDARRRAKLEARLAQDPVLAAEAEAERRVAMRLRETAHLSENTANEQSLWPSIQARLEPRRPSIRPLILVGGLSAATATLIGAALWGPLKPSLPVPNQTKVASGSGVPNVIIVGPLPIKSGRHSGSRHHPGGNRGKRNVVPHLLTVPETGRSRDETQPQDMLAVNRSGTPDRADTESTPLTPKFTPSSGDFRLTTNQHPSKPEENSSPTASDPDATPRSVGAPPDGAGTNDTPPMHPEAATPETAPAAAVNSSGGTKPKAAAATTQRRRRHRRHGHTKHSPAPSASEHDGTVQDSTGASVSAQGAPPPPKSGTKPVD